MLFKAYTAASVVYGAARSSYYVSKRDQKKKDYMAAAVAREHNIDAKHIPPGVTKMELIGSVLLTCLLSPVCSPVYVISDIDEYMTAKKNYIASKFKFPLLFDVDPLRHVQ